MKIRSLKLLCLVLCLALSAACASHTIGGFNLDKLEKIREGEGPRVDAYFEPLGKKHYALLDDYFGGPQEPMPREHLFFAVQKMYPKLEAADISLTEPVHVRAVSNQIELTFRKNTGETVTVKLPPNIVGPYHPDLYNPHVGEPAAFCKDGQLLILRTSSASNYGENLYRYSTAIVFQVKGEALTVHTRQYKRFYGAVLGIPFLPVISTDIQQEGYVYEMVHNVLKSPGTPEASEGDNNL